MHVRTNASSILNKLKELNHYVSKIQSNLYCCFSLSLNSRKKTKKFTKLTGYLTLLCPLNFLEVKETFRNAYAVNHKAILKNYCDILMSNVQGFTGLLTVLLKREK